MTTQIDVLIDEISTVRGGRAAIQARYIPDERLLIVDREVEPYGSQARPDVGVVEYAVDRPQAERRARELADAWMETAPLLIERAA